MDYQVIDLADWPRAEYFDHYLNAVPCSYSMTVQLELTAKRREIGRASWWERI